MAFRRVLIGSAILVASLATAATAGAAVLTSSPLHLPAISFLRTFERDPAHAYPLPGREPAAPADQPLAPPSPAPEHASAPESAPAPAEIPAGSAAAPNGQVPAGTSDRTSSSPAGEAPEPVPTSPGAPATPPVPTGPAPSAPDRSPAPANPAPSPAPPTADLPKPLHQIPTKGREVVLTFDDGPSAYTAPILQILAQEKIHAAFFWIAGSKGITRAADIFEQGNQLGTHTVTHLKLTTVAPKVQTDELTRSRDLLQGAAKADIPFFRPPYGAYNTETLRAAQALGLTVVLWNVDSRDWALADHPEQIVPGVMQQVKPGAIILLHERAQTVKVLPDLIKALRDAGYTFRLLPAES